MQHPVAADSLQRGKVSKTIFVYDRRFEDRTSLKKLLEIGGLDFNGFLHALNEIFSIRSHESFVLVTTDRTVVDYDEFEKLQDGITLYLLQHENQSLSGATEENILFEPHYDTLIQSGTFEYYADGQKSLPYALAELVDNSISATAKNTGERKIEIRMLFEKTGKPAIVVLDNGCGMTSKQLNDWAVYRLSKFQRKDCIYASETKGYVPPDPVPRSLNSDISYFGVGGKHAAFFIGESVKMITKTASSPDVHEFSLSKQEFERKQENKEAIFSGVILNRKPCDSSHVKDKEHFLHALIDEEAGKKSFTAVVITGIKPEHITYLKQDFDKWTVELSHVYHYYIHGRHGNDLRSTSTSSENLQKLDIQITLRDKPSKCPCVINLREVENDMQTLYIKAAADVFEFSASIPPDQGTVEGIIRYHPFLYDRETYPVDPYSDKALDEDDDCELQNAAQNQARRNIFECYWNGRLIPYTTVSEFDWCSQRVKSEAPPAECYNRLSGVLFTDGRFQVSTNKLHFMELELKLKSKDTIFTPIVNAQKISKRGNIQKEFQQWLQNCHQKYDKQVKFVGYRETITRTDQPKRMQHPWATFSSIQWGNKTYKEGQRIKSQRTGSTYYCTIIRFLLYGSYDGDVFATGGQVEICREPKALYDTTKIIPISKIDQTATIETINKAIDIDTDKLPEKLSVYWPEGNVWSQDSVWPAGTPLGPLRVEVQNRKGESLSGIQTGRGQGIRMSIQLIVVYHGSTGDEEIVSLSARFLQNHGHWFKKIEDLTKLGNYTVTLNTMLSDSPTTVYGGRQLPSYALKFTLKEGNAESFTVTTASPTVHVGVPFNILLQINDCYGHPTAPPPKIQPILKCSDLVLSQGTMCCAKTTISIKGVKAHGKVLNSLQFKSYELKVTLPGLKKDTSAVTINLLPGKSHSLHVKPEANQFQVENGNPATFNVEVHDEAGNITANPKQTVRCQVSGLPLVSTDCSRTGAGQLVTKPINVKIISGKPQRLNVQFDMPSHKHVDPVTVELEVLPSSQVSVMKLYCQSDGHLVLRNNEKIEWQAGGQLGNLFYKLYDEVGKEVPLTAAIASMIKVNWTGDIDQGDLIMGRLPDVQVPTQVQEERFYQVSYRNQSVSFSFTVVPCPDEPTRLKVTLPQSTVKLGETLSGQISLELVDQFDNVSHRLTVSSVEAMTVEAEGLDKSSIKFKWQESSSSVLVTGVRFSSGSPGPRELCFSYKSFEGRVMVTVTPGVPSQLKLLSGPEQPLQVLNGHGITTPFLVQLCDEWGNPSPDQRVVVEIRTSPVTLKVTTSVSSQPVDPEGKARFKVNAVSGSKGYYQLEFKGSFNREPIPGPVVNLTVIPDSNKPVRLDVEYNTEIARFLAGDIFPVFSVTVVSDEGCPITKFPPSALYMSVWKGESSPIPPANAKLLRCSKPMEHDRKDRYYFRDKEIPREVGKHTIQFSLHINKAKVMYSNQISIDVVANKPVKLGPDFQPTTPVVSYSMDIGKRTLIENMTLKLMDAFGNPAGQNMNGKVVVSIINSNGEINSLPLFERNSESIQVDLEEGKAVITRLAIMEKSPGEDGRTYKLLFKPEVPTFPTSLESFELPFYFYNDGENQQKMAELTKKKDEIEKNIEILNEYLGHHSELKDMYTKKIQDEKKKELGYRNELQKSNMTIIQPLPSSDIDTVLNQKKAEASMLERKPRRVCTIPNNFTHPDVLGMVAHLAFIEDDEAARVISWHLRGDLDCIITRTTAAARSIYNDTNGRQQVMALDSIHVQQGARPLPHMRGHYRLFDPRGNPVYAKDLLIHPREKENCEIVFKNLLGDTIVMDDLDSATEYRKAVVGNRMPCPTILTRQGERVSSKGKFGGTQNKAPPITQLPVFGAPLPQIYYILTEQIELLSQYGSFKKKMETTIVERDKFLRDSSDMLKKKQNLQQQKEELEGIKRQLALASARPGKRGPEGLGEPSGIITKKPRGGST
ncbi:structural maintenance of chromosomes flexible hinge domain-containing protein 1 [Melanotaenia boesemani]|uniref:structural maintenance of chromosomes flexible hinge domain-containing protein 1 n=1 Tax=Melanotaenia boesemani TaxID=1250792 RepID=UPI001C05AF90|nr:structural maintenance of chromosomes flexible hinge domain-containing protein 1 [Melanotaenia boesemani]